MKKYFYLLFAPLLIGACTYKPLEEAFNDIPPGTPRPFTVAAFNSNDTIYVHQNTNIGFDFDPTGKDIIGSAIFMGDEVIDQGDFAFVGYTLDPTKFSDGLHSFRIEYYQKTFSGSLADKIDAEVFTYSDSCFVLIDNVPVPPMVIKSKTIVDGQLVIEWNEYTDTLFQQYEIYYEGNTYSITDPTITSLPIPEFGGGSIMFRLTIYAKGISKVTFDSYEDNLDFAISYTASDSLKLSWSESPYNSTDGVVVQCFNYGPTFSAFIETGKSATDTLIYFPSTFPYSFTIESFFAGGLSSRKEYNFSSARSPIDAYWIFASAESDLVGIDYEALYQNDYLKTGNLNTQSQGVPVPGMFGISPNGENIFSGILNSGNSLTLQKHNPKTGQPVSSPSTFTIPNTPYPRMLTIAPSNDDYIFVGYGGWAEFIVYHWPTKSIVHSGLGMGPSARGLFWLANGGNVLMSETLYADVSLDNANNFHTNAAYPKLLNLPHRNQYVYYDGVSKSLKLTAFGGDFSTLQNIPVTGTVQYLCANEYNDLAVVLLKANGTYWVEVYDLESGEKEGQKRISTSVISSVSRIQLTRNLFRMKYSSAHYFQQFDFPL